jgi:hypothetical protein
MCDSMMILLAATSTRSQTTALDAAKCRTGAATIASPFSVGWWAIASEELFGETMDGGAALIPRGALVRYREWYGAKKDASGKTVPNVGLKMKNEDIGAGIKETLHIKEPNGTYRTVREQISYGVLNPRCFANEVGTPIAEAIFKGGATFRQADNARVREFGAASGWGQVRGRLIGNDDGGALGPGGCGRFQINWAACGGYDH